MPSTLRPDDHIWVAVQRNGVGVGLSFQQHLSVGEIGKDNFALIGHGSRAESRPKGYEAVLRMPVNAAIAFLAGQLNAGADDLMGNTRIAELVPHRQALEFGKIREKSRP